MGELNAIISAMKDSEILKNLFYQLKRHEGRKVNVCQAIDTEKIGTAKLFNHYARQIKGDFFRMDDDITLLQRATLTQMSDFANRQDDIGIVVPLILRPDGRVASAGCNPLSSLPSRWDAWGKGDDCLSYGGARFITAGHASLMFIKRACYEDVGGFDERYYPVWVDDVDFCIAAGKKGWRTLAYYDVKIIHHGGQNEHNKKMEDIKARNRALFDEKWKKSLKSVPNTQKFS